MENMRIYFLLAKEQYNWITKYEARARRRLALRNVAEGRNLLHLAIKWSGK